MSSLLLHVIYSKQSLLSIHKVVKWVLQLFFWGKGTSTVNTSSARLHSRKLLGGTSQNQHIESIWNIKAVWETQKKPSFGQDFSPMIPMVHSCVPITHLVHHPRALIHKPLSVQWLHFLLPWHLHRMGLLSSRLEPHWAAFLNACPAVPVNSFMCTFGEIIIW